MSSLLDQLKDNPFVLAPMAGITDLPFRSFMREMGCGVVVTELVSATGLQYSSDRTKKIMQFAPIQHPVGIQIFGENLHSLDYAAKAVEQAGADFVDLNFGCPVPKVVKRGAGAAILKDLVALREVLRTVKAAVSIPVTIKIRTGWDEQSQNAIEVAQVAFDEGITWVAIHGRTRAQGYNGHADWEYIRTVKQSAKLPILGNGDLVTPQLANERMLSSGVDGVMIGRGCLKNPWIFQEARDLFQGKTDVRLQKRDFLYLFGRLRSFLEASCDERTILLQTKKLAAWYSAGHPGASAFRKTIFQVKELAELYNRLDDFFAPINYSYQPDTFNEPFLMGGHG